MATEQDLAAFTAASGRDWDQLCQAWIWNICATFGRVVATPPSAIDAYYASNIVDTNIWSAPVGSIVYFDIAAFGHVSTPVDSGEGMASARVQVFWGINAGTTDLGDYLAATGATPLGWSWDNAGNTYPYQSSSGPTPGPEPEPEEDDMKPRQIHYLDGNTIYRGYFVPGTNYFIKWQDNNASIANGFATAHETGASVEVTKGLFEYFENEAKS